MIFSSTVVNYGTATGVVTFTGMKTAIGRVQKQVQEAAEEEEDTPLKQKLDDFGEKLSYLIGVVCLLVWIMNYKNFFDEIHGSAITGCIHYFKIAIALAVAAIPEGLPAVITTCLALGTRKMAKNNAIVRRLPSVETLGCTTVICSDKTGTLTKNQMCVIKFSVITNSNGDFQKYNVSENKNSYEPFGKIEGIESAGKDIIRSLAVGCTVNNRAEIVKKGSSFNRVGEPTEAALKVLAEKLNQTTHTKVAMEFDTQCKSQIKKIATLDFTSERKAMSTVVTGYKNEKDLLLKGAPDRIIDQCVSFLASNNQVQAMTADVKSKINKEVALLSAQGLRCLAVAEVPNAGKLAGLTD